ncbi:uncharacterized protein V1516DRAFT_674948 [Lipomyces oligophaga]|uniref:uncharacterized protein n=1 Tax=Lipomyces oligophaga TaxID=45792 RepID=UPI0034CD482C
MAPPPTTPATSTGSASPPASSSANLIKLAKTLQFGWFVGHVFVLLGVFFYFLSALRFNTGSSWARFWYRESYFAVIVTYGIVLYRSHRASTPTFRRLIRDDNFQYLLIALLWFISKPLFFTTLPFAIYSAFHVLTYLRTNLLPALGQASSAPLPTKIQTFVDNYNDKCTSLVANLELVLFVRLFLRALTFRRGSWITLLIYGSFVRLRLEGSVYSRQALRNWGVRIDSLMAHPKVPPAVKGYWEKAKTMAQQGAVPASSAKPE